MTITQLVEGMNEIQVDASKANINVKNITHDSRKVTEGSLFVCIEGYKTDGHDYIKDAVQKGASAVLVQKDVQVPDGVLVLKHPNTRKALAEISSKFYDEPSKKINLIGVTGTKGKTTTTFMIKSILEAAGHKVGLIGTIANYIGDKALEADRTTPESLELQKLFSEMYEEGVDSVVMEVSSHSLDLFRVHSCDFNVGVFTNLSQDHLDFHLNFENYFNAKSKLFNICKHAKINIDDSYGKRLKEICPCPVQTFGIESQADIFAKNVKIMPQGTSFTIMLNGEAINVNVSIPGRFTVYNSLAAVSACVEMKVKTEDIVKGLERIKVPGRAETVETDGSFTVMVDYAHSPDSLKNILEAVKVYADGRIVSVFGCGGDRDRKKRPIMGEISGELADFTIITSDNPRTEDPEFIVAEIEEGIKRTKGEYIVITDRRSAIEYAIKNAKKKDIIVIAGKGHETYQIFKDKTIHFDDKEVAREALKSIDN